MPGYRGLFFLILPMAWGTCAWPVDVVTFHQPEGKRTVVGEILVTAEDGGVLLMDRDGVLWEVQPETLIDRVVSEIAFAPSDPEEYARRLLAELPSGFRMRRTSHYVFLYDTSTAYAKWCGVLYERLYRAFYNFWRLKGQSLQEPEFPLIAIIFAERESFNEFGRGELGPAIESIVGYYSMRTNLVVMYDLTGIEEQRMTVKPHQSTALIQQVLSQPASASNVATIVHEATHQLAYNSGLQNRYAENPLWLSEGLAMFFETPDFRNDQGWRSIGGIHPQRLGDFRRSLHKRSPTRLIELFSHDELLRDPQTAATAYADAWALCYYLLKKHPDEFSSFVGQLSKLAPLQSVTPDERLALAREHFGDLDVLNTNLIRYFQGRAQEVDSSTRRSP